ncbi:hypothetical protein KJ708_14330 [bacterium]|nr:hypothetical protein [bacterium]MBU1917857.1 hypothetical protein [bacterium]
MKNNKFSILIRVFILIVSCAAFYQAMACSGSAAPTASLPNIYNDEPITISAPDANGFVTVTGGADSVGASTVVILGVSEAASSSISLLQLCDALVGEAYATTCSSDLPVCPTLDSDNKCHVSSDSDGAFTTTVPATTSDQITISYLDPTDCTEVTVGVASVSSNIISLPIEAIGVVKHPSLDYVYVLGNDADGDAEILKYDTEAGTYETYIIDLGEAASKLDSFIDHNSNFYLVVSTSEHLLLAPIDSEGAVDQDQFVSALSGEGLPIPRLVYLFAVNKEYNATLDTCISASMFDGEETSLEFTRIFFGSEDALYYVDFVDTWTNSHDYYSSEPNYYTLNTVDLVPSSVTAITGTGAVRARLVFLKVLSVGSVEGVIRFSDTDTEANYYAVFNKANYNNCDYSLDLSFAEELQYVDLGTSAIDPIFAYGQASNGVAIITVLKQAENQLLFVDPFVSEDGLMQCLTSGAIDLPNTGDTDASDTSDCASKYVGDAEATSSAFIGQDAFSDVTVTDIVFTMALLNSEDEMELFVLGSNNSGYDFVIAGEGDSLLKNTDSQINALTPMGMDQAGPYIYIVDKGNAGDNTSNLIIYEML